MVLGGDAAQLPLDAADGLLGGEAAVADGGVELLQGAVGGPAEDVGQKLRVHDLLHGDAAVLQLRLKGRPARHDILVLLLLLEPLADLAAGLAGLGDLQPVPAGALGGFGGDDLHDVTVFQAGIQRHNAAVDLGADHVVAHGGVDGVGEVDGRGPGGQVLHVAVGGEDEDLVREHIHLQGVDILLGVGAVLILQQAADPLILPLGAGPGPALLILPVGGHAVLGDLVHLLGADLDLEGDAVRAHDGGVEGLVAVGLGGADIVLEAAEDGLIEVVDDAQDVVAVPHAAHDHPEGEEVKDLVQLLILAEHLAVDGVGVLHPAVNGVGDAHLLEALVDLVLGLFHEGVVLRGLQLKGGVDLLKAHGVQVFEGQVLQLPLDALHA